MHDFYKQQAKLLRQHLSENNLEISHSHALEAISKINGSPDWDTFSATLNKLGEVNLRFSLEYNQDTPFQTLPKQQVEYFLQAPSPYKFHWWYHPPFMGTKYKDISPWVSKGVAKQLLDDEDGYLKKFMCFFYMKQLNLTRDEYDNLYLEFKKTWGGSFDNGRYISNQCRANAKNGEQCRNESNRREASTDGKITDFELFVRYAEAPFYYCRKHQEITPYEIRLKLAKAYSEEQRVYSMAHLERLFCLKKADARLIYKKVPDDSLSK